MGKIKIAGYVCERCAHQWVPRNKDLPIVCSRCKSPYWNIPRKIKNKKMNNPALKGEVSLNKK